MILYKDWGKHIRLGNWWFNYAALLCIAKRTGHQLALPDYHAWPYMAHPPAIDTGHPLDFDEVFHFPTNTYSREAVDGIYDYFLQRKNKNININLGPNNQSEKWFLDELDHVKEMIRINPDCMNNVREKYLSIFNGKPIIGVGVRRGDFVGHGVFYQIPLEWYIKALEAEFPNWRNCNILFFSDHIEEIKTRFLGKNFYFAEPNGTHTHADNFKYYHNNPMEQFILGTMCDHFIGGNSTFSWWQMWYVKNFNGGKVVHCGRNLSDKGEQEFGKNIDYYPESWTLHGL